MINMTLKAICLWLAMISPLQADPPTAKSKASGIQVLESETSHQLTFTDTVKVVRDLDGATEVLFVKRSGVFTAPEDGGALEKLIMSQKSGSAVSVVADEQSSKIIRVSPAQEQTPTKPAAGKVKSKDGK